VACVCDDDQAIYRWRGAAISNVLAFLEKYPEARQVVLTENYRSHQRILDSAYRLIVNNNPDRLEVRSGISKHLLAARAPDGPVPIHQHYETGTQEADAVAHAIREHVVVAPPPGVDVLADGMGDGVGGATTTWRFSCAPTTTATSSCARSISRGS